LLQSSPMHLERKCKVTARYARGRQTVIETMIEGARESPGRAF